MDLLKRMYPNAGRRNKSSRDLWLKNTLSNLPDGIKILDAGAGQLQYKKYCEHLQYISQDFGKYDGQGNNVGLQTNKWDNSKLDIISDITDIPVEDASFDAIMCVEVFEHIPAPVNAIKEFSRILRIGGQLIITAPVSSMTHFAPYYFYNGFSRYFYEHYLAENGFEIIEFTFNGNWFDYVAQELNRLPYMLVKYAGFRKNIFVEVFFKIFLLPLLYLFNYASIRDKGSNELHSFGIHLVAKKINELTQN